MNIFRYEFERRLSGACDAVRQVLIERLQSLGCRLDRVESNSIQGHLGTSVGTRLGRAGKPPLTVRVLLLDLKDSVQANVQLADAEEYVFDRAAFERRYSSVFEEVQHGLDEALRGLDPELQTPAPRVHLAEADLSDPRTQLARAVRQHTRGKSMPMLETKRRLQVVIDSDTAVLEPSTVDSLRAVSNMALSDPTMPQSLLGRAQRIHAGLVSFVDGATGSDVLPLEPSDRRIFEFLYRQTLIRGGLPVRELYRCLECDYKKITNPEYQRELGKARLKQNVVGGMASALTMGYMAIVGTAARALAANSFDFVCPQCQGRRAEVALVTLCPGCKKLRTEPVLRKCATPGCNYDFMGAADVSRLWSGSAPPDARPPRAGPVSVEPRERPLPQADRAGSREGADPGIANLREAAMTEARRVRSVFVSFAEADAEGVRPLLDGLRRMHYDVFLPETDPEGRLDFQSVLAGIERCDAVLIALSPAWLESQACASERAYASRLGKHSLVITIEHTEPQGPSAELASLPTVDFTDPGPVSAFELADQLSRLEVTQSRHQPGGRWPAGSDEPLADVRGRLAAAALSLEEQERLVAKLTSARRDEATATAARDLLCTLQRRRDLFAGPARDIETILAERPAGGRESSPEGSSSAAVAMTPAGWYADPTGRHQLRWFDGDWSDFAGDNGVTVQDPL